MPLSCLIWDQQDSLELSSDIPVGEEHYYSQNAQSLYIRDGTFYSQYSDTPQGQWAAASNEIIIDDEHTYSQGALDHPSFGILFGSFIQDGNLIFMDYLYAGDISDWIKTADISMPQDAPVYSLNANILDIDESYWYSDVALFSPGNKITVEVTWGDENWIPMHVFFIDSIPLNRLANNYGIQARTILGAWCRDLCFDEQNTYSGTLSQVLRDIISDGISFLNEDYLIIQEDTTSVQYAFKANEKRLDKVLEIVDSVGWKLRQLPDGRIAIGSDTFIRSIQPNSIYEFSRNTDLFTRKINKNADTAFSRVCAHNSDWSIKAYADVSIFAGWNIAPKTYYVEGPDGAGESALQTLADLTASRIQNSGVSETLEGPMRPYLLCGDLTSIQNEGESSTVTGIVTQVKHTIGTGGYLTIFTTDSAGDYVEYAGEIESSISVINGLNRMKRVTDFFRGTSREITSAGIVKLDVSNKVDKIDGKGLSSNDFTDELKSKIESSVNIQIILERLSTPPSTPADGNAYLVIATASGDWAGHENDIAVFNGISSVWEFTGAEKTDTAYDDSEDKLYIFTGSAWILAANGWSGSFTNADGNTVTIINGLITNIQ